MFDTAEAEEYLKEKEEEGMCYLQCIQEKFGMVIKFKKFILINFILS